MDYDVFISHASEDKQGFVEPLAQALIDAGLQVLHKNMYSSAVEKGPSVCKNKRL